MLIEFITTFFVELEQLTGVAAILRFPMPELEDEESDNDEKADWDEKQHIFLL